jgi:hypothetical protein
MPDGEFDTIMCNYVLNVIESEVGIWTTLSDIRGRLADDGVAYISVRANRKDLKGLTKLGTWQGLITLGLPIVYKDADCITYVMRKDCIGFTIRSETFPEG